MQGVKFLALSPGEFFFTTLKVSGYAGLLVATPTILYEVIAYVIPGLTKSERSFLAPVIFGSSILFYLGLLFSYEILTPAALKFFVSYADGAVESFWSIDQYFEFVLVLMLSTGLAFQVCLPPSTHASRCTAPPLPPCTPVQRPPCLRFSRTQYSPHARTRRWFQGDRGLQRRGVIEGGGRVCRCRWCR